MIEYVLGYAEPFEDFPCGYLEDDLERLEAQYIEDNGGCDD